MAKSDGYLPVSSSEEFVDTFSPDQKHKPRFGKVIQASVVALSVLGALGLGYSLGGRHAKTASVSTIRMFIDVAHLDRYYLALVLTSHSNWRRCALLHAVQQDVSSKTEQ
jgi:hypothetical protein